MDNNTLLDLAIDDNARKLTENTFRRIEQQVPWLYVRGELRDESQFERQMTAYETLRTVGRIDPDEIRDIRWMSLREPFARPQWLTPETYEKGRTGCLKRPMYEMIHMSVSATRTWPGLLEENYLKPLTAALGQSDAIRVLDYMILENDGLKDHCRNGVARLLHIRPSSDPERPGERLLRLATSSVLHTLKYAIGFSLADCGPTVEDIFIAVRLLRSGILLAQAKGEPGNWCALMR